jgi:sulfoquinovosyltransferase
MMKGEALSQAYASADIFVMPSETETLGFVVLEAMASGVPVVAVAAGGLTDIITQPGKTGLLYEPGDYAAAAQLVKQLIADPDMRQKVSSNLSAGPRVEIAGGRESLSGMKQEQAGASVSASVE